MPDRVILATRRSPLALRQARLAQRHLSAHLTDSRFDLLEVVTTGDRRDAWSLEERGGKGLFTGELEAALQDGRASMAVHSAKDLPTEMRPGLAIAGYLPREWANDVLIVREGRCTPQSIATGSPRRRAQARLFFPDVAWKEIRGNVESRLEKIAAGAADATILASAGLKRLGIAQWPGVILKPLSLDHVVPAVGQGAVALQTRAGDVERYRGYLDRATALAVNLERHFLARLGGGCHTAFAAHFCNGVFRIYHESCGIRSFPIPTAGADEMAAQIDLIADRLV